MKPIPVFSKTSGLNVNADAGTIDYDFKNGIAQLQVAADVDINDKGRIHLTQGGFTVLEAETFYSLWRDERDTYVCKGSNLYLVNADLSTTLLYTGLNGDWVYFCQVQDEVLFSDGLAHKTIKAQEVIPWPYTDRRSSKSLKHMLQVPPAINLTFYLGRVFFTIGDTLFWTELNLLGLYSPAHNHITFEDDITVVAAVEQGLFISTDEKTWFMRGSDPHTFKQSKAPVGPAIHRRSVALQRRDGFQLGLNQPGDCIFFTTNYGAAIGTSYGEIVILNQNTVMYPQVKNGACVVHNNQLRQVLY